MRKPVRKDYSGAAGAGVGSAVGILIIGALRQLAGVEMGAVEAGAVMTLSSAAVSLIASWLTRAWDAPARRADHRLRADDHLRHAHGDVPLCRGMVSRRIVMPTELSWSLVLPLIVDGLLFGIGFALANALLALIGGFIASARTR
jgi:Na+-translocating ferredoxin:NAD+ oxidoreductase RnfE subunit